MDEEKILTLLELGKSAGNEWAMEIVEKARQGKGLELEELAILLQTQDQKVIEATYKAALEIKNTICDHSRRLTVSR